MAAVTPHAGGSDASYTGVDDHTLWMLLRALVARRPVLPAMLGVFDANPLRLEQRQIGATVRDLADFEHAIGELLALPGAPKNIGSARAVASTVVRMCREFAQRWPHDGPLTNARMTEFERDIEVLEVALDAIAARTPRSPF